MTNAPSSNGKTADFESANRGSSPRGASTEEHAPLSRAEKLAAFISFCRLIDDGGASPGFGRITEEDDKGVTFAFSLPNFMARKAAALHPDNLTEAGAYFAAQGIEARQRHDREAGHGPEDESPVASGDAPND